MGKKEKRSNSGQSAKRGKPRRKTGYTAGEWFMVLIGALLVVLFAGIVITSMLGD